MSNPESHHRPDEFNKIETKPNLETEKKREVREHVLQWLNATLDSFEEDVDWDKDTSSCCIDAELAALIPDLSNKIPPNEITSVDLTHEKKLTTSFLRRLIRLIESPSTQVNQTQSDRQKKEPNEFSISIRPAHLIILSCQYDGQYGLFEGNQIEVHGSSPHYPNFGNRGELTNITDPKNKIYTPRYHYNEEKIPTHTLIENLMTEGMIDIDTILDKWTQQQIRDYIYKKNEIATKLQNKYITETEVILLYNEVIEFLKTCDDKDMVGDVVGRTKKKEMKAILFSYKRSSCREAVETIQAQLIEKDAQRYSLHRKIEAFNEIFLGKSKMTTAAMLELGFLAQERAITIWNDVLMVFPEKSAYATESVKINLGIGETYNSVYHTSVEPAKTPTYHSFVSPERNREQDILLADTIIHKLHQTFPTLQIKNDLHVFGSFHEQFAGTGITISEDSFEQEIEDSYTDEEGLVDDIKKIILIELQQELKS